MGSGTGKSGRERRWSWGWKEIYAICQFQMFADIILSFAFGLVWKTKAETDLQFAFDHIPPKFHHNRRLVLHYLIPTRLLHGSLPSSRLLEEFPELSALYRPLALAIKTGNVQLFDEALSMGGSRLVGLGTYLTVERSRGVAVRVLFKKV